MLSSPDRSYFMSRGSYIRGILLSVVYNHKNLSLASFLQFHPNQTSQILSPGSGYEDGRRNKQKSIFIFKEVVHNLGQARLRFQREIEKQARRTVVGAHLYCTDTYTTAEFLAFKTFDSKYGGYFPVTYGSNWRGPE
jgi:hypothetical protein